MSDLENRRRFLNPCLLHLQKMALELKCPFCLNLLSHPMLLPCDHIFCSSCISRSVDFGSDCPVCKLPFLHQDLRPAPHMENMVCIYKRMDAAFGVNLSQLLPQVDMSDAMKPLKHHVSGNLNAGDASKRGQRQNFHMENSCDIQSSTPFSAKKRVLAPVCSAKIEIQSPESILKSTKLQADGEVTDCTGMDSHKGKCSANEDALVNENGPTLSLFPWLNNTRCEDGETHEGDMGQLENTSSDSPPSFDDIKDSDYESNDQGSEQSAKTLLSEGTSGQESEDGAIPKTEVSLCGSPIKDPLDKKTDVSRKLNIKSQASSFEEEDQTRESKRQKLDGDFDNMNPSHVNTNPDAICAFCQSSRVSKASGPMLHYSNGTLILADQATQSNVFRVHKQCVEWAPQVYFVGETVMNLEAEVTRGLKIKCSSCGLKGAALGCYAKCCRRSFHVPCAIEISECRWDYDNFLMLCPAHSSFKLPNERSKHQKKIRKIFFSATQLSYPPTLGDCPSLSNQKSSQLWTASPDTTSEWVLCGSALSSAEKDLLSEFTRLTGAPVTRAWNADVTHVIASVDDMGACSRTLKFLMAILNGRWILKIDWIKACMEAKRPVCEAPHEISCDVHGCRDGPKNGRIRVKEKVPKLFSGLNFYFHGDFVPSYKGYLQDLLVAAGGTLLLKKDMVPKELNTTTAPSTIVIYSLDPPQNCNSNQFSSVIEQRLKKAEAIAAETGARVAGHAWLLESIAGCKLRSLD